MTLNEISGRRSQDHRETCGASRTSVFRTRRTKRFSMNVTRRVAISIIATGSILVAGATTASAVRFSQQFQTYCAQTGGSFYWNHSHTWVFCEYSNETVYCPAGKGNCGVIFASGDKSGPIGRSSVFGPRWH